MRILKTEIILLRIKISTQLIQILIWILTINKIKIIIIWVNFKLSHNNNINNNNYLKPINFRLISHKEMLIKNPHSLRVNNNNNEIK